MGYAKYYEDNEEITNNAWYMDNADRVSHELRQTLPDQYLCPRCNKSFYSRDDLRNHIREKHNSNHAIVRLNGSVMHEDTEMLVPDVHELIITVYDDNLQIKLNGQILESAPNKRGEIDLTDICKSHFVNNGIFDIEIEENRYMARAFSRGEINIHKISNALDYWNNAIEHGKPIIQYEGKCNAHERMCLDGFFNYYVGCEASGDDRTNRFYEADAKLSQFSSVLSSARLIKEIVAFNFNWFEKLSQLCTNKDLFAPILDFIYNRPTKYFLDTNIRTSVFIDNALERIVNDITYFQKGQIDLMTPMDKLDFEHICKINDINSRDKLLYLQAKRLRDINLEKARLYYDEIQSDFFPFDRKDFLGGANG